MKDKRRKIIALLICIFWLPLISSLFPIPKIEHAKELSMAASKFSKNLSWAFENDVLDKNNYDTDNIYKKMWKAWVICLFIVGSGLISAAFMFINMLKWKLIVVFSSLLYLYNWHFSGSTSSTSIIKAYELKAKTAEATGTYGNFIYKDILLPIVFLSLVIYIVSESIYSKRSKRGQIYS